MRTVEEIFDRHAADFRVMLAGDWHGNTNWALYEIKKIKNRGVDLILQLGDFGFWPRTVENSKFFLDEIEAKLDKYDIDLFVTLGNHEDWGWFTEKWEDPKNRDANGDPKPLLVRPHIIALPKVYKFTVGDKEFLSVGGAVSVDRQHRVKDFSWFDEEMITEADVSKAIALGPADFMLTHESPSDDYAVHAVREILVYGGDWIPNEEKLLSALSRDRISRIFEATKPKLLAHGHMHCYDTRMIQLPDSTDLSWILSLNCDGIGENTAILNFFNEEIEIELL